MRLVKNYPSLKIGNTVFGTITKIVMASLFLLLMVSYKAQSAADINYNWDGRYLNIDLRKVNEDVGFNGEKINCGGILGGSKCYIELVYGSLPPYTQIWMLPYDKKGKLLIKDVLWDFNYRLLPKAASIYNPKVTDCIVAYLASSIAGYYPVGSTCDGSLPKPPAPPVTVSCSIKNDIVLNHGTISEDNVLGHVASGIGFFQCTDKATVRIYAKSSNGKSYVNLNKNGTFVSYLKVGGYDGASGAVFFANVANAPYSFEVSSTLSGLPKSSDEFSGNGILVISVI